MTHDVDETAKDSVIRNHGRHIIHMRQQLRRSRFGLVFGAGASKDFGFPQWDELINRIAAHPDIASESLLSEIRSHSSKSQVIFQAFRNKYIQKGEKDDFRLDMKIRADWRKIVHTALYQDIPSDICQIQTRDKYLYAFLDIIRENTITINYNFDNTIQRMLEATKKSDKSDRRRESATVWNSDIQMLPRRGVIYHPNGFLPYNLNERPSDHLIFNEDTFADQLIDSFEGHYGTLSQFFAQNTCLFVGLSLDDPTLKHMLRQNAKCHPGHCHYYIAFTKDSSKLNDDYKKSISDANFETYNLITLFLNQSEMAALGKLLSGASNSEHEAAMKNDNEIKHMYQERGESHTFKFLVTGAVSVGKSTSVGLFRSLKTYDEWLAEKPAGMEKDPSKVDDNTIKQIDQFVFEQLKLKNRNLADAEMGIHIIDRAPLDAFAFTKLEKPTPEEWREKANKIITAVRPKKSKEILAAAKIILLVGDPEIMAARARSLHKVTNPLKLSKQQALLKEIYSTDFPGICTIDTRGLNQWQVAKKIAQIIFRDNYIEFDMQGWIDKVIAGEIAPPSTTKAESIP